jgi:Ferritin-like domain
MTMRNNHLSSDELRRQLRGFGRASAASADAQRRVVAAALSADQPSGSRLEAVLGRRDVFRLGGFAVSSAAVLAACAYDAGTPGRVGDAEPGEPAPTVNVDNSVLLRTASSLEHSAIEVYQQVIDGGLLEGAQLEVAKRFQADHREHALTFENLTEEFGGTPFTCGNPKIDSSLIQPALDRILKGAPATGDADAIGPSDNVVLDVLILAHGLENLAGATYQSLVAMFSEPSLRADAMAVGKVEARHAALLAMAISPDGGILPAPTASADTAPTTTAAGDSTPSADVNSTTSTTSTVLAAGGAGTVEARVLPVALPNAFGQLGAYQIIIGKDDVNGVRMKVNLETPSLNSLIYKDIACPSK